MIEKQGLEERLARLKGGPVEKATTTRVSLKAPERRKYPPVLPKFQNPSNPSETSARQGQAAAVASVPDQSRQEDK
jgi:DNA-binding protein H-NS